MKLLLSLLISSTCISFSQTISAFYTPIDFEHCVTLSSSEWDAEPVIDYIVQECPGLAGYQLFVKGGDARSWLELAHSGHPFPFAPWDLGDAIQGLFPYVKGTVAEWRYSIAGDESNPVLVPHALIYRMAFQDINDETKEIDQLVVLRLANEQACFLGATSNNESARELADTLELSCFDE